VREPQRGVARASRADSSGIHDRVPESLRETMMAGMRKIFMPFRHNLLALRSFPPAEK